MKNIPKFESESEEQDFLANNDSTEFLDWSKAIKVHFAELKLQALIDRIHEAEQNYTDGKVRSGSADDLFH